MRNTWVKYAHEYNGTVRIEIPWQNEKRILVEFRMFAFEFWITNKTLSFDWFSRKTFSKWPPPSSIPCLISLVNSYFILSLNHPYLKRLLSYTSLLSGITYGEREKERWELRFIWLVLLVSSRISIQKERRLRVTVVCVVSLSFFIFYRKDQWESGNQSELRSLNEQEEGLDETSQERQSAMYIVMIRKRQEEEWLLETSIHVKLMSWDFFVKRCFVVRKCVCVPLNDRSCWLWVFSFDFSRYWDE
jgi:hypothetical protein